MPELTGAVVEQYTKGRLVDGDDETTRLLASALASARRYCGWHVTPEREDELTLDGPGGRLLRLPTLRLVRDEETGAYLVSIVEDGVEIDPADLNVSPRGMVTKKSGAWWSTTLGAIRVTMTHGFDDAPDFDAAVLSGIDRASLAAAGGRLTRVGPFQYEATSTADERASLDLYRLERAP